MTFLFEMLKKKTKTIFFISLAKKMSGIEFSQHLHIYKSNNTKSDVLKINNVNDTNKTKKLTIAAIQIYILFFVVRQF